MDNNYIYIYNSLVKLTRNKVLYKNHIKQDTFSDRLIFFLLHFNFFLKVFKNKGNKNILQDIHDYVFRQLELSIREIGYGDQSINKRMKDYINLFYSMIDNFHMWETSSFEEKSSIIRRFLGDNCDTAFLIEYFDNYSLNLLNNTLNSYIKGVIKT